MKKNKIQNIKKRKMNLAMEAVLIRIETMMKGMKMEKSREVHQKRKKSTNLKMMMTLKDVRMIRLKVVNKLTLILN